MTNNKLRKTAYVMILLGLVFVIVIIQTKNRSETSPNIFYGSNINKISYSYLKSEIIRVDPEKFATHNYLANKKILIGLTGFTPYFPGADNKVINNTEFEKKYIIGTSDFMDSREQEQWIKLAEKYADKHNQKISSLYEIANK